MTEPSISNVYQLWTGMEPSIEAVSFRNRERFRNEFALLVRPNQIVLDYFWRFNRSEEESTQIAGSLGRLITGITTSFSEFNGLTLGCCDTDLDRTDGQSLQIVTATLVMTPDARLTDPTMAALGLVDAINDDLSNLRESYSLPIPDLA